MSKSVVTPNPEKAKKESVERIIQNYLQAKAEGNTLQIKLHENILKRLGVTPPR